MDSGASVGSPADGLGVSQDIHSGVLRSGDKSRVVPLGCLLIYLY